MWALMPLWQQSAITDTVRQHFFLLLQRWRAPLHSLTHACMQAFIHTQTVEHRSWEKYLLRKNKMLTAVFEWCTSYKKAQTENTKSDVTHVSRFMETIVLWLFEANSKSSNLHLVRKCDVRWVTIWVFISEGYWYWAVSCLKVMFQSSNWNAK